MNWNRGFYRVGIVIAVLWFTYWAIRCVNAYMKWSAQAGYARRMPVPTLLDMADQARTEFFGNLIAAFLLPALALGAFLVLRWIIRGFRQDPA